VKDILAEEDRFLTPGEVAALFRVDPKTVTRWAKTGRIPSQRTPGGHVRVRESVVRQLLLEEGSGQSDADQVRIDAEAEQIRSALCTEDSEAGVLAFEAVCRDHPGDAQQVLYRLTGAYGARADVQPGEVIA
jgi:excisionase family DNA binding protein